jgi:O-methyltransferase
LSSLAPPYPDVLGKVWRRVLDTPWRVAALKDRVLPGELSELVAAVRDYTMVDYPRLRALYQAVKHVEASGIPGDVVECGTARGGSAALMGMTLERLGSSRRLWVFDTFEGLPPATEDDPDYDHAITWTGRCRGDIEDVEELFQRSGIRERAELVKGLFQDTLPTSTVGPISVLHIDADWYQSVKDCLDHLYDKVSPGGIIQFDDYGCWEGARKAVHAFIEERRLPIKPRYVDPFARQLIKP